MTEAADPASPHATGARRPAGRRSRCRTRLTQPAATRPPANRRHAERAAERSEAALTGVCCGCGSRGYARSMSTGCGGTCGRMPERCRQRVLINGEEGDTKSRAGRRVVGLPAPIVQLCEHKERQERDREHARQLWRESGYVFTSPTGQPLNLNSDYHRWKALLRSAAVRDARLHDARHTAATVAVLVDAVTYVFSAAMVASLRGVAEPRRRTGGDEERPRACRRDSRRSQMGLRRLRTGSASGGDACLVSSPSSALGGDRAVRIYRVAASPFELAWCSLSAVWAP